MKETCDVCKENKYGSKDKEDPLKGLRKLKRSNTKIMKTIQRVSFILSIET